MHNMRVNQSLGLHDGSVVKNLPAGQDTGIQSLGQEDHLAEGKALLQYSCLKKSHGQRKYSPKGGKE